VYFNQEVSLALIILGLVATGFFWLYKANCRRQKWALFLIMSGGLSNGLEAAWRGGVQDYLKIGELWFNVPDLLIVSGVVMLAVEWLKRP
jgi:lipoprotein signal peptidase